METCIHMKPYSSFGTLQRQTHRNRDWLLFIFRGVQVSKHRNVLCIVNRKILCLMSLENQGNHKTLNQSFESEFYCITSYTAP